ncbi:alpha/beta hydrolase (plasmid) [Rhizobium sp. CCGE531]|nr:alpha/beta hydrolase [Rhizobium sp. CCGE531]AYG75961.1 alpha/beta hydrolase [Rhizobium sp. CCGE532]
MASNASSANKNHYETLALAMSRGEIRSPEDNIEWADIHWTSLTAEPRGVDYIEADADGVPALWIVPKRASEDRVIFYAHGGGFIGGSIYTHRKMVGHLAKAIGCRALMFQYAYAHQKKYPHQLETAVSAYRWLLKQDVDPKHMAFAGDSAGAILTFGALQRARSEGIPLPAAAMIISGWFDLAQTGATYEINRAKDIAFAKEGVDWLAANVLGEGADHKNPLASALYADLRGLPPVYLQAGADETLLDDSRMFAERAKAAGVEVQLDIYPEMLHSFQMMAGRAPEADAAIEQLAKWGRSKLGLA